MMRPLLTSGLVLATLQQAIAQSIMSTILISRPDATTDSAPTGTRIAINPLDGENGGPAPSYKTYTGVYTDSEMYNSQDLPSMSPEELSSYSASLTSAWGPFHTTFVFMPGAYDGDWLSAVASGGDNDETTTWEAYGPQYFTDPGNAMTPGDIKKAYWTMMSGPTVYHDEMIYPAYTNSDYQNMDITATFHGAKITTHCTYTAIAPKISIPDEVWATQDFETLMPDNWATVSGECTIGAESLKDTESRTRTIQKLTEREGWRHVTVLGEKGGAKAVATGTESGEAAKQTGSAGGAAQAGSGTGTDGAKATSTQAAGSSEVTAWVNAVVVVAAVAAMAV